MKRSWFGAGLLVLLLGASALVTHFMEKIHEPLARDLVTAGEYAIAGDWDRAEALSRQVFDSWEQTETFRQCFADHTPVEEVDAGLAEVEIYLRMKEETAFAAACAETARKVQAIGQAHSLVWENVI